MADLLITDVSRIYALGGGVQTDLATIITTLNQVLAATEILQTQVAALTSPNASS